MATRMRFCFDFLDYVYCAVLLKNEIYPTRQGTLLFLSISDNIAYVRVYRALCYVCSMRTKLHLVREKCLDKNKRQITRNFSRPNYAILYFNGNCNAHDIRNKMPSVMCEGNRSQAK